MEGDSRRDNMTALSNGDRGLHPSFFIERVAVTKYLANDLQRWREMSLDGWDLVVLLELADRNSVIAFGVREE